MQTRFPKMGIGAGSLANADGEAAFIATVQAAWEAGVRYFDTSALYLGGESERRLGLALQGAPRAELLLSTKLGRYQTHTGPSIDLKACDFFYDYSAEATEKSVERSLKRLGVDQLDAVYIHDLGRRRGGTAYPELFRSARDEAYPTLCRLKAEGVIGAIGIASMEWEACLEFSHAVPLDVVMPAGEYSLLRTRCTPLLEHCEQMGIEWIAAAPFNSGILVTGARPDAFYNMKSATPAALDEVAALQRICARHSVPLAAAAIQFPLRRAPVTSVVLGAKSPAELHETHALLDLPVPEALWTEIEAHILEHRDWEASQLPERA